MPRRLLPLLAAAAAVSIITLAACSPRAAAAAPDRFDAMNICRQFVTDRLHSPSGAVFSPSAETSATFDGGTRWHVRGWVDSAGTYGPRTRSDYDCTVTVIGSSGTGWTFRNEQLAVTPR